MFWRSGNGKLSVLTYQEWPKKCRHSPLAREWGGLGGHPPFEEATSTPGAGVGGFGGPPFEEATSTTGAGGGGCGVPPFEEVTSTPGAGVGGSAAMLIEAHSMSISLILR